jgi:hypothetical protein
MRKRNENNTIIFYVSDDLKSYRYFIRKNNGAKILSKGSY